MVAGGMSCIKYLLFAFNLVFFLIGLALIVIGALVQAHVSTYALFLSSINGGGILVIVVGSIIFVVAFFGCCGAIRENHCMVRTFAVFLGIILILEVVAAILGFVFSSQIESMLRTNMQETMPNYHSDAQVKDVWDQVQTTFNCCGVANASDWEVYGKYKPAGSVPDTCCKLQSDKCGQGALSNEDKSKIYVDGCVAQLESTLKSSALAIGIAALCFAAVQLIGVLFACCLASAIRKEYELV